MAKPNSKVVLTSLLFASCVISGIILASAPAYTTSRIQELGSLDSLLMDHFESQLIVPGDIRRFNIEVDTLFKRTVYRVNVPPSFSKTMFHYELHQHLNKYNIETPAKVLFPERDMNIYIVDQQTVRSTIRLITSTSGSSN